MPPESGKFTPLKHYSSETIHILLVEDNAGDARLVQLAFADINNHDFQITHVEKLGQALDEIQSGRYSAVLLDLSLPDSQGVDTVIQVKSAGASLPVIVLSGQQDEAVAIEAVKAGAQDYLVKGQENGYVIARSIRYAIERQHAEEALRKAREELEIRVAQRTDDLIQVNNQLRAEIAEREISQQRQQYVEQQLRLITDALPVVILYVDTGEHCLFANKAFEQYFGCPLVSTQDRALKDIMGNGRYAILQPHLQAALTGSAVHCEVVLRDRHGELRHIELTLIPHKQALKDRPKGVVALIRDITEQKTAEQKQRQQLLQLTHVSRLSTTGEMATQIAHEINQPLTAIASFSDACLRLLDLDQHDCDDLRDALKEISHQAERAGEVIRQLRGFVRKDHSARSSVDVNGLVREISKLIEVEARWHGVELELILTDIEPFVIANRILIQQVLLNFVRNAIEAMAEIEGERRLTIESYVNTQDKVVVAVHDTGPGLQPDNYDNVFEPFFTTKSQGMGMGLSISESIIKSHEGRIWVCDNEPGGCSFNFSLPIVLGDR